ncbi:fiber [Duck adenovirus 2]|nr:fiber [Duck adenovirus 2]
MKRRSTDDGVKAKKTRSTPSKEIDLTYPFWSDNNNTPPVINPPLVKPPLFDDNGFLNIKTSDPVRVVNGAVSVVYDDTLTLDRGNLSVKIDPNGPIQDTPNGITLNLGNGLEEDQFGYVTLKVQHDQPIDVSSGGIGINYDDESISTTEGLNGEKQLSVKLANGPVIIDKASGGLTLDLDDSLLFDQDGLGVVVNPNGPLNVDGDGVDIDFDTNTLTLVSNSVSQNSIAVKLDSSSCLAKGPDGLKLAVDTPLTVSSSTLGLNLSDSFENTTGTLDIKTQSPLYKNSNGVGILYDEDSLVLMQSSNSQAISVKLDPASCLIRNNDGLGVKLSSPLQIDSTTQNLKLLVSDTFNTTNNNLELKVQSPISQNSNGLQLAFNNTMTLSNGSLGLKINPAGGLIARNGGLSIQVPTACGLVVNNNGIAVNPGKGLELNGSYLRCKLGNAILFDTNERIALNYSAPFGITSDNKLKLNYNTSQFNIVSGSLSIIQNPLSNLAYAEYGTESFTDGITIYVPGKTWNSCIARPFVTLSWLGSTVSGVLRMKIRSSEWQNTNPNDPIKFAFVLDTTNGNLFINQSPNLRRKYPNDVSTLNKVRPSNAYVTYSSPFSSLFNTFLEKSQMNWYSESSFKPYKSGNMQGTNFTESKLYWTTLTDSGDCILYFLIDIGTSSNDFFSNPKDGKEITLVDVPFFYSGLKINF